MIPFTLRHLNIGTRVLPLLMLLVCSPSLHGETAQPVRYEDFGATGDGKTDDLPAIVKAHEYANNHGLPVRANDSATYFLGPKAITAIIKTDVDFGKASFIIDERKLENRSQPVFQVSSDYSPIDLLNKVKALSKNQKQLDITLPQLSLVKVLDDSTRNFIRKGRNANNGSPMRDLILVDEDGKINTATPVIWDFKKISSIEAYPIDQKRLTVQGGRFTSIAGPSDENKYFTRGFQIERSNVLVQNVQHIAVKGEDDKPCPPSQGFLKIVRSAHVVVRDTVFTARRKYKNRPGTYDIIIDSSIHVSFINCRQTNDYMDRRFWGIMGSNYTKHIVYDNCKLSRFDAHRGTYGGVVRNTDLGYMGVMIGGHGDFLIENTVSHAGALVQFRPDYGSSWDGTITIKNCTFKLRHLGQVNIISGHNTGDHDFGYPCFMPRLVAVDGLTVDDSKLKGKKGYEGINLFANINPNYGKKVAYSIAPPEQVILGDITIKSGAAFHISSNKELQKVMKVTKKAAEKAQK